MPRLDSRFGGERFDAADENAKAVIVELDELSFVRNDLTIPLNELALRPHAHRRVSFRATPASSVTVILRANEWLSTDVLNASRVPPPPEDDSPAPGPNDAPAPGPVARGAPGPVAPRPVVGGLGAMTTTGAVVALARLHAMAARPRLPGISDDIFDPGDVFDPGKPTLPVEVVVSVRGGPELGRSTLHPGPDGAATAMLTVNDIEGNEVIDVTFVNPNDVAVICTTCIVRIGRKVRTSVTKIPNEMFLRVFNGAITSLAPTITVTDGLLVVSLEGALAQHLKLTRLSKELPVSFEGGATFEATEFEIMGKAELVRRVLVLFRERVKDNFPSSLMDDSFLDSLESAYFSNDPSETVAGKVAQLAGLKKKVVERWLLDFPLLTDPLSHRAADPAFAASYSLTGLHSKKGSVSLEVHEIKMSLFLAFSHKSDVIDAPFGDLPLDGLSVGTVVPSLHVDFKISDFDFDIELPSWVSAVPIMKLAEFLTAEGLEELADFLAGIAEEEVPRAIHGLVARHAAEYGELIATTLTTIADRDQQFHRAAATRQQFAIATIDTNQLRVPHDPNKGRRRSPVAGINEQVPPVQPIDHDPSPSQGASPEELLQRIEHFIFVMMENRSFDHMLGYLSHPDHGNRSDVDGLDGSDRDLGGDLTGTTATPLPGPHPAFRPNLHHKHHEILRQINDGQMNGFASEYARKLGKVPYAKGFLDDPERALRFQTPDVVSTYDRLAREYTICDRWFASVPAGTYPNRACYYSGGTPALVNDDFIGDAGYLDDLTVFDLLNEADIDWKLFESDISFLRVFSRYRIDQERIRPLSELTFPLPSAPSVTFIDPNFTGFPSSEPDNDDQPPTDVRLGQAFLNDLVTRIENSEEWASTMLVIIYDEHGGFADHVPPPGAPGSGHPPGSISLAHPQAHTFGVRVPAFVVSPLAKRGGVVHQIFDHSTVFRTLLQRFAPEHVNSKIIPERVRRARHLGDALTDQPPRAAPPPLTRPFVASEPPLVAASEPRRGRLVLDEPMDSEDAAAVLKQIGVPTT